MRNNILKYLIILLFATSCSQSVIGVYANQKCSGHSPQCEILYLHQDSTFCLVKTYSKGKMLCGVYKIQENKLILNTYQQSSDTCDMTIVAKSQTNTELSIDVGFNVPVYSISSNDTLMYMLSTKFKALPDSLNGVRFGVGVHDQYKQCLVDHDQIRNKKVVINLETENKPNLYLTNYEFELLSKRKLLDPFRREFKRVRN